MRTSSTDFTSDTVHRATSVPYRKAEMTGLMILAKELDPSPSLKFSVQVLALPNFASRLHTSMVHKWRTSKRRLLISQPPPASMLTDGAVQSTRPPQGQST